MAKKGIIAIDLGRRNMDAVFGHADSSRVAIDAVLREQYPDGLDPMDPKAIGSWLRDRLDESRIPRTEAVFAMQRRHIALKRIILPQCEGHELPEMTRLAMQRELPFDADSAVIDFVTLQTTDEGIVVLAVACPDSQLAFLRSVAQAAGVGVARVSLRSFGAAALMDRAASRDGVLQIDVSSESVEFSAVEDGTIRFSRAGELPDAADDDAIASAVITEARRTWMSYRIVEGAEEVRSAVILAPQRVAQKITSAIGSMLSVRTDATQRHADVSWGSQDPDGVWPLAGLLLRPVRGLPTIDFAHPRKAPDLAARRRQRVLMAAGAAAVLLLALWTIGQRSIANLEKQRDEVTEQDRQGRMTFYEAKRTAEQIKHIHVWRGVDADWLAHLETTIELAPSTEELLFESWNARLDFKKVEYDRKKKSYVTPREMKIVVEGEAKQRAIADRYRDALVSAKFYTAKSSGADGSGGSRYPNSFTYSLSTSVASPVENANEDAVIDDSNGGDS